jgi:hypothetical protein
VKQLIKRILREEFRNLSSDIEELLQPTVDKYSDYVCEVQVFQDVMNPKKYSLRVIFVGGSGSKNWPTTQAVQSSREKVMKEMWETIYKFTGLSVELDSSTVRECKPSITESPNKSEITERCWKGYTQKGMKTMFGKRYPNCVKIKKKSVNEASLADYLKKIVSSTRPDPRRDFQKVVDLITKVTKREVPVEGLVGVEVVDTKKEMWGVNYMNDKDKGRRWDFSVVLRFVFTSEKDYDESDKQIIKFKNEFTNNAYGMGLMNTSPITNKKVKDYRVNFMFDMKYPFVISQQM